MRRILVAAGVAAVMVASAGAQALATPPAAGPGLPPGWQIGAGGALTWTAPRPVPFGDAAVEFWAGERLLGRPEPAKDGRSLSLTVAGAPDLRDLQVRSGERRLDVAAPATARSAAAPVLPAELPANPVDPGLPGRFTTVSGEYDLPAVKLPDFPAAVEMRALVVAPAGVIERRPLVLLLHGRHLPCYGTADEYSFDWPCPAGQQSVPSYRGYRQAQELLASQGYVTVSISANGINGQDNDVEDYGAQARSSLVRLHLAHWAEWAGAQRGDAPAIVRTAPPADMSKVLLMGHSRGGEGVNRAAVDSLTPPPAAQDGYPGRTRWTVRGTVLVGPTIFGHDPAPDVPSVTILPGCDGDVSDLQGQQYLDATTGVSRGRALHSALYVIGANHNFFNTEWTPGQSAAPSGDDFYADADAPDPLCDPGTPARLTAAQQQDVGATYLAAAARLFVRGDDAVRPLLDGSGFRAPSAGPARVLSHAVGAAREPALTPDLSLQVTNGQVCRQVSKGFGPAACLPGRPYLTPSPHFVPFSSAIPEPGRFAVAMTWPSAGQAVTLRPKNPKPVAGEQALALRMFLPPNTPATTFGVAVTGSGGTRTELGDVTLEGLPGTARTASYWAREVRVPLPAGVSDVAELTLTPRSGPGQAWLVDAWGWSPGTPAVKPADLPRIDVGHPTVPEGDAGSRTVEVPVRVTGRGNGKVRLWVSNADGTTPVSTEYTVTPATESITVPVETGPGDDLFGYDRQIGIVAKAVRGVVVGDYVGGLTVADDDPRPDVTWDQLTQAVTEGGTFTYRATLSAPTATGLIVYARPQAPAAGAELSTADVDPKWFTRLSGETVQPERPLSQTFAWPYVFIAPGETTGSLTVPTVVDRVAEPAEHLELQTYVYAGGRGDDDVRGAVLTGTLTD